MEDLLAAFIFLLSIIVIFALVITVWRLREEYRPDTRSTDEFTRVRPRRQGFDMVYRPKEGVTYEIIGRRWYTDGSADFLLKHGRTILPVHFEKHQLAPRGGNFLSFLAPEGSRVAIELDGNIMDGPLGESEYAVQWDEVLRQLSYYKNAYAFAEQRLNSLDVNFEDAVTAEVERTTTKVIPSVIKSAMEAMTKRG